MRELRFKPKPGEPKFELRFEKKADRELRLQKEEEQRKKAAEPRGPKIDTSGHRKKPKGTRGWGFSLDGSRNGSVWIYADYDDAVDYAKSRFPRAAKIFVL